MSEEPITLYTRAVFVFLPKTHNKQRPYRIADISLASTTPR